MEWKIECDDLLTSSVTIKGIRIYSNTTEKETLASMDALRFGANLIARMQLESYKIDKQNDSKAHKIVEEIQTIVEKEPKVEKKSKSLEEKFKEANKKLNEYFDKAAYDRLVYKLKTNDIFYYRMKDFFSERKFITDVEACVESGQMLFKVKRVLRYLMQHVMCVPEFVFGNMGKSYDDSEDQNNDKLWGYLTMVCNYFFKKSDEIIGCLEMSKRIYGLMIDAIGEASSAHSDDYKYDNWD